MTELHNLLGMLGVVCILGTYLLLQLDRISQAGVLYSSMNAAGAGLILVSLSVDFNLPAVVIESAWLAISVLGIYRTTRGYRTSEKEVG
jgi:hypothetical protein